MIYEYVKNSCIFPTFFTFHEQKVWEKPPASNSIGMLPFISDRPFQQVYYYDFKNLKMIASTYLLWGKFVLWDLLPLDLHTKIVISVDI